MSKKRIIIIVVGSVVVLGAVLGFTFRAEIARLFTNISQGGGVSADKQLGKTKLATSISAARAKVTSGDPKAAQEQLDKAIEQTDSGSEKAELYTEKANISANSGDSQSALDAAKKAAESNPSAGAYDYVGLLAEQSGNNEEAIAAYKKAIEEYKKNPPKEERQVTAGYYEMKIKQLEGQQ